MRHHDGAFLVVTFFGIDPVVWYEISRVELATGEVVHLTEDEADDQLFANW